MLIAVNYHYIRESFEAPYPSIFGVTPLEFTTQLDLLGCYADFLGHDDILDIIDGKQTMPERAVVITFDDGFKEQYEIAWPILRSKGIPAILFVNTKPILEEFVTTTHKIHVLRANISPADLLASLKPVLKGQGISFSLPSPATAREVYKYDSADDAQLKYFLNYVLDDNQRVHIVDSCFQQLGFDEGAVSSSLYMTKEMVGELALARSLGTHGHAHVPLGLLGESDAKLDIDSSVQSIREWTGYGVQALSYPFGFLDACTAEIADHARSHEMRFAFTMERAGNETLDQPFFMARFSCSDVPGGNQYKEGGDFWQSLRHATWFREESGMTHD